MKNESQTIADDESMNKSTEKAMFDEYKAEIKAGLAKFDDYEFDDELEELEFIHEFCCDEFGKKHWLTVRAKYELALAYWRSGDEWETYQLLLEVYLAWKGVKKPKDAEMLELRHTLGLAALECEYPDEAYTILKEVYELRCEAFGEKDEDTIETLVALIKVCNHLNHPIKCKEYIEKYEALTGKKFDENHQ